MSKKMADKYRHLTKEWHASKEGHEWHRAHGIMTWVKRESFKITCKVCGKESETKTFHQEFCSGACKSKWRRDQGLDHVEKICKICSKPFMANKYVKNKTCSRVCGQKIRTKSGAML